MTDPNQNKAEILRLTREYSRLTHQANRPGYTLSEEVDGSQLAGNAPLSTTNYQLPTTNYQLSTIN